MAGWRNGGMAEVHISDGMAEWWNGCIPNLPDIFMVHADDDVDNDDTDTFSSFT